MIKNLPPSLIEAATSVLLEESEDAPIARLKHVATVKTNFPEADYWVVRKGGIDDIGRPTNEFNPEHIGVKIDRTDILFPKYHQYSMQFAHQSGYFKQHARGTLRLQNLPLEAVKNMPIVFRGLNEAADETENLHPMIDVDGEKMHRHNSLGIPIHHTDDGIRNFHRWFSGSRAVDIHGRPHLFYHGTTNSIDQFEEPNTELDNKKDHGWYGKGIYFTADPTTASAYSVYSHLKDGTSDTTGANVVPVYLRVKTPYKWDSSIPSCTSHEHSKEVFDNLRNAGYDGVFVENKFVEPHYGKFYEAVVYSPNQIKSAIGNSGEFSPFRSMINEAAVPDEFRHKTFYHGTGGNGKGTAAALQSAISIANNGIQPPPPPEKEKSLTPMAGRTYCTPDIGYAQIYALCGDTAGSPRSKYDRHDHGFVFSFSGDKLHDILPDEDSVGELYGNSARTWGDKTPIDHDIRHTIERHGTEAQLRRAADGEYEFYAKLGKRVIPKMPVEMQQRIMRKYNTHISNAGAIIPDRVHRISLDKKHLLAKDGSNFFEHADELDMDALKHGEMVVKKS